MNTNPPQFIFDQQGNKAFAILPIADYEAFLEQLEDFEDTKIFAQRRSQPKDSISLDAFKEELKREGRISG